ncbi:MAG: stage III sporulation protein AC [Eubacteriales bacterium]|nr:stage III sporulation protein AC [Clostridiales bacterium]MDD6341114.1 stage III sporulation protein AC [Eubacteriales bacterium]MDD7394130.1 stage III sporulation protein AC [Eubacteriales bacterium]MDY3760004.1 stage III sporulation protein AC [Eubacteriales bacterium]
MDISVLFKIAAVGLIVAVLNQILNKTDRGEYAMLVTVAGLIAVILVLLDSVTELFGAMRSAFGL